VIVGALAIATVCYAASPQGSNGDTAKALHDSYPAFAQRTGYKSAAEVAAYVSENVGIVRSIHVKSVTRPQTGVFCVKPSVVLDLTANYPIVNVEWSQSSGNSLVAYIDEDAENCSSGEIEVRTYNIKNGTPVASNNAGFFLFIK
jgi:hypothetical protein